MTISKDEDADQVHTGSSFETPAMRAPQDEGLGRATMTNFTNFRFEVDGDGIALDELERRNLNTALVTLCIGAGMGTATIIERV